MVRRGKLRYLLSSSVFTVIDVSIAVGLNLWFASTLAPNTVMLPGFSIFWAYMLGVTALWTGLRSPKMGALIVIIGAILLALMSLLNRVVLSPTVWSQIFAQEGWLAATFVVSWVILVLARRGAGLAVDEGLRAGRIEERAQALRVLHTHILETLQEIMVRCEEGNESYAVRLPENSRARTHADQ